MALSTHYWGDLNRNRGIFRVTSALERSNGGNGCMPDFQRRCVIVNRHRGRDTVSVDPKSTVQILLSSFNQAFWFRERLRWPKPDQQHGVALILSREFARQLSHTDLCASCTGFSALCSAYGSIKVS
jgi:hypothetical protein